MTRRLVTILVGLALITGAMLTAWGLAHLSWPRALPWSKIGLFRYAIFLLSCTTLVIGGSIWSKRNPLFIGAAVSVGVSLLAGALWPLLVTLWFAVASALLGKSILAVLRVKLEEDSWLTNFLVGAGVYGTAVGLLAHFPVSYPGVYGVGLALPLISNRRLVVEQAINFRDRLKQRSLGEPNVLSLDVPIAVIALIYFVVALMPEVGFDSLAMHLFIPSHVAERHQWGFDANTYVWAVMPMLGDWIFSVGYMLAGETAARLINVGFIFILCWLIRDLVVWAGGSTLGARWAVIIFLSTPLTFMEGSSLFIESVWASFVVAATLLILRISATTIAPKYELPIAGLLLGCALASKAVTFSILPILMLLLVWQHRYWFSMATLPSLSIAAGLFLVIGLIPYATAWWLTGNPVFPFFNGIFQSPYYPAVNFDSAAIFGKGLSWDMLYRATFESGKFLEAKAGASGFQWLLLLLPSLITLIVSKQRKGIVLLLVGSLMVALVFQSVSYFRYAFPAWAIFAAAIGAALSPVLADRSLIAGWWHAAAVATVALNLLFLNAGGNSDDFALRSISGEADRRLYLQDRLPIRNAVELVNRLNAERAPVAIFGNPLAAGLSADALYPNWYNFTFQKEIASVRNEQDLANVLLRRQVRLIILDSNWKGVNCCSKGIEKQSMVETVGEKIMDFGSLSVRRLKRHYRADSRLNDPSQAK